MNLSESVAASRRFSMTVSDVWNLYQSGGISDEAIECFVTYLAGHNRPTHEVLFGNEKDIAHEYRSSFLGMTTGEPVTLDALLETRAQLRAELPKRLTDKQRQFLLGLTHARPNWGLLKCPHADELPALRWKLSNLETFSKSRPADFQKQIKDLERQLV